MRQPEEQEHDKVESRSRSSSRNSQSQRLRRCGGAARGGDTGIAGATCLEVTGLLKSLKTVKAIRVRAVKAEEEFFGLLDGGATHALRQAKEGELQGDRQGRLSYGSRRTLGHCCHQRRSSRLCRWQGWLR